MGMESMSPLKQQISLAWGKTLQQLAGEAKEGIETIARDITQSPLVGYSGKEIKGKPYTIKDANGQDQPVQVSGALAIGVDAIASKVRGGLGVSVPGINELASGMPNPAAKGTVK